jgi:hypothetical protein
MANHKHQALQAHKCSTLLSWSCKVLCKKYWQSKKR